MPTRVLFVDDEPNVLNGLRRMLYPMRDEWTMSFVPSAAEALELMEKQPQDVVVSDMRMPKMDGAQFLAEVRSRYPQTVRIILSGHSDHEMILKSIGPTHQYLTKPCEPAMLRTTIQRSVALSSLLGNEKMKTVTARMDSLPSMPALFTALVAELQKPDASLQSVGKIVSQDVGMTAQILRLVNSAFFGLRREISDPGTAVTYLGLNTVTALVMSLHIFKKADEDAVRGLGLDRLWQHGMNVGLAAKTIAKVESQDRKLIDDAFAAGLLHTSGQVILAVNFPKLYGQALDHARKNQVDLAESERLHLEVTHAEVGAYLMGIWGLPNSIIEAMAYHRTPGACVDRSFSPLTALHVACHFEHVRLATDDGPPTPALDRAYIKELGLEHRIDEWWKLCGDAITRQEESRDQAHPAR